MGAAAQRSRLSPKTLIPPAQSPRDGRFLASFSLVYLVGHLTASKEFRQQPDVSAASSGASPTAMGLRAWPDPLSLCHWKTLTMQRPVRAVTSLGRNSAVCEFRTAWIYSSFVFVSAPIPSHLDRSKQHAYPRMPLCERGCLMRFCRLPGGFTVSVQWHMGTLVCLEGRVKKSCRLYKWITGYRNYSTSAKQIASQAILLWPSLYFSHR